MSGQSESVDTKGLTTTPPGACTAACTSNPENNNAGTPDAEPAGHQGQGEGTTAKPVAASLASLAAAVLALDATDRERLAAMLKGDNA